MTAPGLTALLDQVDAAARTLSLAKRCGSALTRTAASCMVFRTWLPVASSVRHSTTSCYRIDASSRARGGAGAHGSSQQTTHR
jgi:hypothetical protein